MGKHTAVDEAVVHPLVAQALERRRLPEHGTHRPGRPNLVAPLPAPDAPPAGPVASSVGWPADPGQGEGLGWPGDPQPGPHADAVAQPGDDGSLIAALEAAEAADGAAGGAAPPADDEAPRRSGWRRFFGGGHTSARSGTSAA